MTLLAAALASLLAAPPLPAEPTVAALVDKTVQAYGGVKQLSRPLVLRQTGKLTSTMRGGAGGHIERVFQAPQRLRVEVGYAQELPEVRVLVGERCVRGGREVQGPPRDAVLLQAARMALPLLLEEKKGQLKDLGSSERNGAKVRTLEVPLAGSLTLAVEVEPATGHIVRSVGRSAQGLEFIAEYADFRKVDGVLVPFTERTFAMGQHTSDITLEKVEYLQQVPAGAFELPASL